MTCLPRRDLALRHARAPLNLGRPWATNPIPDLQPVSDLITVENVSQYHTEALDILESLVCPLSLIRHHRMGRIANQDGTSLDIRGQGLLVADLEELNLWGDATSGSGLSAQSRSMLRPEAKPPT